MNIDKIHKIHAPKIQVCVLGRKKKKKKSACGRLIDHGVLGGTLKSTTHTKLHKMHAPKIQGRVFSEVAEAPQAARYSSMCHDGVSTCVRARVTSLVLHAPWLV